MAQSVSDLENSATQLNKQQFPCQSCGADLKFAPGTDNLVCPFCDSVVDIVADDQPIHELSYVKHLKQMAEEQEAVELLTVSCGSCNAVMTFDPNVTADECPFCGISLVRTTHSQRLIKPQAVLPFKVPDEAAHEKFESWLRGLWFAPNDLKKRARTETGLQGVYIPYWTYDSHTATRYKGQRGTYYYVTERYSTTENGKQVTRTRRVRKTRWRAAQGQVQRHFDDVIVVGSESLPTTHLQQLEPWDLAELEPYQDEYLSGFRSQSYGIDLADGFEGAKLIMGHQIERDIRQDIGGDEQRISTQSTQYEAITFKHILLPIWISSYRYREQIYRFVINGQTGEVQGERPYSWLKIALAVIAGLMLLLLILWVTEVIELPLALLLMGLSLENPVAVEALAALQHGLFTGGLG